MFGITTAIRKEDACVHHLRKTDLITFFHLLNTGGVAIVRGFLRDIPITLVGASHTKNGVEHVLLTDREGVGIDQLVSEVLQTRFLVATLRLDGKAEEGCHCATDLRNLSI